MSGRLLLRAARRTAAVVPGPRPIARAWLAASALALLAAPVHADEGAATAVPLPPRYQQECGACHLAFAPGLLPAASWQRLMGNLPRHFGTDASLDEPTRQTLAAWLNGHAGTARKLRNEPGPPPDDRITRAAWFQREHREVPAATWQRPAIQRPSNCAACHGRADLGEFRERDIRIPR